MTVQRILVPLAFGEHVVADFAEALAKQLGAAVTLLHVTVRASLMSAIVPGASKTKDAAASKLASRHTLEQWSNRMSKQGLAVSIVTREGSITAVILDEAARGKYDLIVMGLLGRSGLGRILYGSITESVIGRAPCPVTMVPRHLHSGN